MYGVGVSVVVCLFVRVGVCMLVGLLGGVCICMCVCGLVESCQECQGIKYLETEDNGPDETQRQPVVAIHNIMRAHVLQVHPLLL